jgi:hypothetical protein
MDEEKQQREDEPHDEEIDYSEEWILCCSHSSKEFVKYIVTVLISVSVLAFSGIMIILNHDDDNSIYFSLMSSILTLYIPAPTMKIE